MTILGGDGAGPCLSPPMLMVTVPEGAQFVPVS